MNGADKRAKVGAAQTFCGGVAHGRDSCPGVNFWRGLKYAGGGNAITGRGLANLCSV